MLILHAFPATVLLIPIFILMWQLGLLNTLLGIMLVIVGLELPLAVFIMKGFFDAVPWEIEMSALTDGATRRQAFFKVVLPQTVSGMIAVSVFVFIRGWEEFVFVLVLSTKQAKMDNEPLHLLCDRGEQSRHRLRPGIRGCTLLHPAEFRPVCVRPEVPDADDSQRREGVDDGDS